MGDPEQCYRCGRSGHWSKECPRLVFSDRSSGGYRDRMYGRDPYPPPPPPPFLRDRMMDGFRVIIWTMTINNNQSKNSKSNEIKIQIKFLLTCTITTSITKIWYITILLITEFEHRQTIWIYNHKIFFYFVFGFTI